MKWFLLTIIRLLDSISLPFNFQKIFGVGSPVKSHPNSMGFPTAVITLTKGVRNRGRLCFDDS